MGLIYHVLLHSATICKVQWDYRSVTKETQSTIIISEKKQEYQTYILVFQDNPNVCVNLYNKIMGFQWDGEAGF
jgi:hypothetical protein